MRHNILTTLATAMTFAACGSSDTLTAPSNALAPDVQLAVATAIQDEYHAEETYLRVLADIGDVMPFYNIVYAEQRHSASLVALLDRRGLTAPARQWNINNVPRFPSLRAACAGAVDAEVENIALYDGVLTLTLPNDVRQVFTNNRAASVTKHLPAFRTCQ